MLRRWPPRPPALVPADAVPAHRWDGPTSFAQVQRSCIVVEDVSLLRLTQVEAVKYVLWGTDTRGCKIPASPRIILGTAELRLRFGHPPWWR
jgi:hypothetical protein